MKEFIEYILKSIVNNPDEVEVNETVEDTLHIYSVKVSPEDMGLVIGKGGKTIKSIREMAIAKAIKEQLRINIVLEEENAEN